MTSQTLTRPKSRKKKKASRAGWIAWWPLLAGVAITLAAVKTAEVLPLMGADGLRSNVRRKHDSALPITCVPLL